MKKSVLFVALTGCSRGCFVAGTRISTPSGWCPIDQLQIGDIVWAWSIEEGRPVERPITAIHRFRAQRTLRLRVGEIILSGVTAEHPFWDPVSKAWRLAGELAAGDMVLVWPGADEAKALPIARIEAASEASIPVFNITIDGEECYFAEGILVHNKSPIEVYYAPSAPDAIIISHSDGTQLVEGEEIRLVGQLDDDNFHESTTSHEQLTVTWSAGDVQVCDPLYLDLETWTETNGSVECIWSVEFGAEELTLRAKDTDDLEGIHTISIQVIAQDTGSE